MNNYATNLYNDLMKLCEEVDLFFFHDRELDRSIYRVFSYHMGSYSDFCRPSALECRGVMFLMKGDEPISLVSLPFPKFFNLFENPFTMNPFYTSVKWFEEKSDGSLISTYMHEYKLRLKSKTSLESIMAIDAMKYLDMPENIDLRRALKYFAMSDFTVIMEWCDPKPESRIVLFYDKPQLRIFGVRDNRNGEILDYRSDDLEYLIDKKLVLDEKDKVSTRFLDVLAKYSVERYVVDDPEQFALSVPEQQGIEGYIMVHDDDYRIKIKTQWYITQHRLKDSVTNEKALFACAVNGATDDLKSIFHDNPDAVRVITEMEEFVKPLYVDFVMSVEKFAEDNKSLDRKSYAIKGQEELSHQQFHCAMSLYLGKTVDYSSVLIKNAKLYLDAYNGKVLENTEE